MLRSLVSTARRQRVVALLGVVSLSLAVPPAFGAPSVASQVKSALKLAKRADKNATTALKLAKTAGTSSTGVTGAAGTKGATGAAGTTGPVGTAGAAGPAGAKGDAGTAGTPGAKGDTGATGATGPQGVPGTPAPAGGGSKGFVATMPSPVQITGTVPEPIATVPAPGVGAYLTTATVELKATSSGGFRCELLYGATVLDATYLDENAHSIKVYAPNAIRITLTGGADLPAATDITVRCAGDGDGDGDAVLTATHATITAMSVGTLVATP